MTFTTQQQQIYTYYKDYISLCHVVKMLICIAESFSKSIKLRIVWMSEEKN